MVALCTVTPSVHAELRPSVTLVYSGADNQEGGFFFDMLRAEIEGRLTAPYRYDLRRRTDERDPEAYLADVVDDAALFVRLVPRRDGSLRIEGDLWSAAEDRFSWSGEFELDDGRNRYATATSAAAEIVAAVDRGFSGFGVIEFENRGHDAPYDIYVNEEFVVSGPVPIALRPGTYDIQVRREEPGFSHIVNRFRLDLARDDYIRLVFSLDRRLPPVSGFTRMVAARDGWILGYEVNGGAMLPMGNADAVSTFMAATYSSIMVTDVLFTKNIWGLETGVTQSYHSDDDDESIVVSNVPVMLFTGLQAGPLFRVDFVVRIGGGLNLSYLDWERSDIETGVDRSIVAEGLSPVIRGVFEFGFRFGRRERGRFSIGVQETTVFEPSATYTWLGLNASVGARF